MSYTLSNESKAKIASETKQEDKVNSCAKCDPNYIPSSALNIKSNVCICGNVWIPSFMDRLYYEMRKSNVKDSEK